ncbi:hypothetical protein EVAR_99565_1 [Eumeta japonica]|uniref:Uncharacterized protein n=1 Tax=Eumeta variegata TaxID=151549 RepID=A0A4C1YS79_EUMVA|nr:hypothetical protein EVAR_99565_1 [Eumeta japonica]
MCTLADAGTGMSSWLGPGLRLARDIALSVLKSGDLCLPLALVGGYLIFIRRGRVTNGVGAGSLQTATHIVVPNSVAKERRSLLHG